jgi:hypothetical protein
MCGARWDWRSGSLEGWCRVGVVIPGAFTGTFPGTPKPKVHPRGNGTRQSCRHCLQRPHPVLWVGGGSRNFTVASLRPGSPYSDLETLYVKRLDAHIGTWFPKGPPSGVESQAGGSQSWLSCLRSNWPRPARNADMLVSASSTAAFLRLITHYHMVEVNGARGLAAAPGGVV